MQSHQKQLRLSVQRYTTEARISLYLATFMEHFANAEMKGRPGCVHHFSVPYVGLASELSIIIDTLHHRERFPVQVQTNFFDVLTDTIVAILHVDW